MRRKPGLDGQRRLHRPLRREADTAKLHRSKHNSRVIGGTRRLMSGTILLEVARPFQWDESTRSANEVVAANAFLPGSTEDAIWLEAIADLQPARCREVLPDSSQFVGNLE